MFINYLLLPRFLYQNKPLQFFIFVILAIAGAILIEELILEKIYFPEWRNLSSDDYYPISQFHNFTASINYYRTFNHFPMKKPTILLFYLAILFWGCNTGAQSLPAFELSEEWLAKIEKIAPAQPRIAVQEKRKVLIFSLHTGYEHWTIPHTEAVVKLLAEKSGTFEVTTSKDIREFEKRNLQQYDAVVLNNNCSQRERRDIFWDVLSEDASLTDEQRLKKVQKMEDNLLQYVRKGGGLVILHGGITMQNKSDDFSEMVGGSFDYHPKQQEIHVQLVDPDHPLVAAFNPEGFTHIDEPYLFNNAYFKYDFRPLLYMEADKLEGLREAVDNNTRYIAWIKGYGKGRVFYASPSHNAQSMENPQLLQFFLDGLQYASGDLKCEDGPGVK